MRLRHTRQEDQEFVPQTPPRNVEDDRRQQAMRNMPAPTSAFAQPAGRTMAPEVIDIQIQRQRDAERAAQAPPPPPPIAEAAVSCLAVLLQAVEDQKAGKPIDAQATNALGDLSRIFAAANQFRLGLGTGYRI